MTASEETINGHDGPPVVADLLLSDVDVDDYEAVIFAGGSIGEYIEGPDAEQVRRILKKANDERKTIAAISIGVKIVAASGVYDGKRVAYYGDIEELAADSGAIGVQQSIVVSENVITAADAVNYEEFAEAIAKTLQSSP